MRKNEGGGGGRSDVGALQGRKVQLRGVEEAKEGRGWGSE